MAEIALALVVVALVAERAWTNHRNAADRNRLVNAIVARNAAEYAGLQQADEPAKARTPRRYEDHDYQVGS